MEQENEWNLETKFGPFMYSKLIYWQALYETPVPSHHSYKAVTTEWHQSFTCGFCMVCYRIIPEGNTVKYEYTLDQQSISVKS